MVRPAELARLLAGAALIYEFKTETSAEEMSWLLPRPFRCFDGMVRVYQPHVTLDQSEDERRHRFFTRQEILDRGPGDTERLLVASLHRWGRPAGGRLLDIDDVYSEERRTKVASFVRASTRRRPEADALKQLTELLGPLGPDDISSLADSFASERENKSALEAKEETVKNLEWTNRDLRRRLEDLQKKGASQLKRLSALDELRELPGTLKEAIGLAERAFDGRIAFTERARDSASAAKFGDVPTFWKCLWSMSDTLYPLFFEREGSVDIEARYAEGAGFGFQLAMTEKGSTKSNPKLEAERRDTYNGKQFVAWPHIKWGREPKLLRVYFFPDHEERLLIVSYCGDHLGTAGTRRLK